MLTDAHETLAELPGPSRDYRPVGEFYHKGEADFREWRAVRGVTTGKIKLTDYTFKTPSLGCGRQAEGLRPLGGDDGGDFAGECP